jgi:ADP-ribosylglycohydrolase
MDRIPEARRALEIQLPREISRSGFAPEVLSAAVHFVNASDSLPTALARSIDFAGQANYCPVLVGSIGGARWGRTQIEEKFLHHQGDLVPRLTRVALALARGWQYAEVYPHDA